MRTMETADAVDPVSGRVASAIAHAVQGRLVDPVVLWVFPEAAARAAARALSAAEAASPLRVATLSPLGSPYEIGGRTISADAPVWAVGDVDDDPPRARFLGVPQGREQDALVETLLDVSRHRGVLSPVSEENVHRWRKPHRIEVLTTPDCPQCARLIQVAHAIALSHPAVISTTVDLDRFRDLIPALDIRGVPVTFVDGVRVNGPIVEWALVQRLELGEQGAPVP